MLKFFIISAVIWFVIIKILRFKFVVIKNSENQTRKEGTISINKDTGKNKNNKGGNNGEYVDYEEIK